MPSNLMNRFGGPRQQAPLAHVQQQRPGFLEQTASGIANKEVGSLIDDPSAYADKLGLGSAGVDVAAADAATVAVPEAAFGATAAPMAELGAAGLAEGAAATGLETAAMSGAAGAGAGSAAALGAAMPWVGAGLLAGKAFGLFSEGGPVDYKKCGGKMKYRAEGGRADQDDYQDIARLYDLYMSKDTPKYEARPYKLDEPKVYYNDLPKFGEKYKMTPLNYRAEGGNVGFFDYLKKSFTEKPEWENYEAVQVPVLDGSGNPTNMTSTVYRPNPNAAPVAPRQPAPVEDRSVNLEKAIARDIYGEYDDGEDMGDASYLAGDPAPYSVQTYPLERRGEIQMKSNTPFKGGPLLRKFGAPGIRRDPQEFNRDLNEYSIKRNKRLNPQPDDGSGIFEDLKGFFKSMGQSNGDDADVSGFNMGGRVGPLKSTQYKSSGGEVYTESYYNSSKK